MKKIKKFFALSLAIVLGVSVLAGCSSDNGNTTDTGKTSEEKIVSFGYVNWADGVAMTNLVKVIMEEKMGYTVNTTMADAGVVFTSLADGDIDFFVDGWLPVTHKDYMEKYGDKLLKLGANYENARIGTVVPSYVDIDSIEQLNSVKDKFDGRIIGIDAGAGVMQATEKAIEEYDLDYNLTTGSGPVMTAALSDAIDNEEWIAVTGWTPHWKFDKWDLKFLDDPKKVYGDAETLYTIARGDIMEDETMTEAVEFLENFKMNDEQLGDLMTAFNEGGDETETARTWMNEHEKLVNSWIPSK